jgi:hypothetical protein
MPRWWCGAGRAPGRAEAAYFRGLAYLHTGDALQAERDALVALAYGPRAPVERSSIVPAASDADGPPPPADRPCWAAALALHSAALEARGDNVPAILAAARALEADPACERAAEALERLSRRVPQEHAAAGGAAALDDALASERERARPEFLRRRPKYYYYYEWMRRRLGERHPELPAPVVDKLLTMDANELDLLLQYPAATAATVARVMGEWERGGAAAVEGYQVPLLSWEEVCQLAEGDVAGTLLEAPAAQAMLDKPADVQMGLLAEEEAGGGMGVGEQVGGAGGELAAGDANGTGGGGGGTASGDGEAEAAEDAASDDSVSLDLDDALFELD